MLNCSIDWSYLVKVVEIPLVSFRGYYFFIEVSSSNSIIISTSIKFIALKIPENVKFSSQFSFIHLPTNLYLLIKFLYPFSLFSTLHSLSHILKSNFSHVKNLILNKSNFTQRLSQLAYIFCFHHPSFAYLLSIRQSFFTRPFSQLNATILSFSIKNP